MVKNKHVMTVVCFFNHFHSVPRSNVFSQSAEFFDTVLIAFMGNPGYKPEDFINRELSWLAFNQRVLDEALSPANPLLERVKFFCITSSNLDEFFEVRVAGIKQQMESEVVERSVDGLTATDTLSRRQPPRAQDGRPAIRLLAETARSRRSPRTVSGSLRLPI